ncbi:OmpA family protein [Achromobacter spanius]|uniref:OmpA family protein n=1 Tax=Achromobacter spanius TaxID=217203 RepID=UPI0037F47C55
MKRVTVSEHQNPRAVATVIVAGPCAGYLFGDIRNLDAPDAVRKRWGGAAAWVLAAEPEDLMRMLRDAARDGAPCAVLLPLVPAGGDEMAMRREWREWRQAMTRCGVLGSTPVPAYVAVYACLGPAGGQPVVLKSRLSSGSHQERRVSLRGAVQQLRDDAMRRPPGEGLLRERLALSVLDWAAEAALLASMEEIGNMPPLYLGGAFVVDAGTTVTNMSAWLRWLSARTGLHPALSRPRDGALPLPPLTFEAQGPAVRWAPQGAVASPVRKPRGLRMNAGAWTLMLAAAVLVCGPFLQATLELDGYAERVQGYESLPLHRLLDKCAALNRVKADHSELAARLDQGGVMAWIRRQAGAQHTLTRLSNAIAAAQLSQAALRLDGMAAFESGSARLAPASASRVLEPVVQLLRANPGLRVQIVGHTDATGTPERNDALSLARAQAVRDELIAMSGAQLDQFEVAGRGAAQPSVDNATLSGRAQNRRVEITLTPPASAGLSCSATFDASVALR